MDKYNRKLIQNVFPTDWKNPKPADLYDLVVIGGGPGGLTATATACQLNAKVAVVEKEHLGGECLNVGCIPSKALLRCSRLAAEVRNASEYGIEIPRGWKVDFPAVMERVRRVRSEISAGDAPTKLNQLGADVFLGMGRFTGSHQLQVGNQNLRFKKAIIATGTQPVRLTTPGLKEIGYLTNQTVFNLTALPPRLAVIGGGPIGCEMAQAFQRFGSKVTFITHNANLLPRDDATATELLKKVMLAEGVQILVKSEVERFEKRGKEKVLHLKGGKQLVVDEVIIAVGRVPAVEGLDLQQAKVTFDLKTGIAAEDSMQTSNPDIYAIGDVSWKHKFTHVSKEMGKLAVQNALNGGQFKRSSLVIPWCTYTDPEIAHVGLNEKEAEERGIPVKTLMLELSHIDRAIVDGETIGFAKLHIKEGTDQLLGATVMARHAGDMISELSVAIASQKGLTALAQAIHPFPTQSEVIRGAAEALQKSMKKPSRKKAA
jgi:dihydrolipoamide dehydrogenase